VTLQERISKLEPRERTLLMGFAAFVAALIFLGLPYLLLKSVSDKRGENQEIRDYIDKVNESRSKIEQKRSQRDSLLARYAKTVPANFIEEAAKQNNVEIADTNKKPDIPHGKKFVEHVELIHIHKAGLLGLSKMLERIETAGYPLAVTRLDVKPRAGEADSYDVEAGISTFERKPDTTKPGSDKNAKPDGSADSGSDVP
jgi:general secretion pathway protein M